MAVRSASSTERHVAAGSIDSAGRGATLWAVGLLEQFLGNLNERMGRKFER